MTSLKDIVCCKCGCLKKFSNGIVAGLERVFYKLGGVVARNPWTVIGLSVFVCGLMGIGLIKWSEETNYVKIWLPRGSRMKGEYDWVQANFPERARFESVVVEDENVLSPESINAMLDIYETSRRFRTTQGENMTSFCIKSGPLCRVNSLLELWSYNESIIRNLTIEDIHSKVNEEKLTSPLYQNEVSLEKLLGHIERDEDGRIIGAKATTMFWFLQRTEETEQSARDWEKQLIDFANDVGHPHIQHLYIYTSRTFDDEAMGALNSDLNLMTIGFSLVFLYLAVSIGKFSLIHHKVLLAAAGLLSIGMSITFTYGFGFITGIMFGPIHQILPFMLLGIGVDDIFVIMESLNHLTVKEKALPLDARLACTMKHAGVSITVTSVTDIVAFAIGSSTVIPSLSTFCIYAAIGVLAIYILQATFFVACLALDEQRKDSRRNACLLCYKHSDTYKPNDNYTFSVQHQVMKNVWGPALTKTPVKVVIILLTVGLTSLNIWSFIQLKNDFDPSMYLPSDSYSQAYVKADRQYFPDDGSFVQLYCGEADYANNIDTLLELYGNVRQKQSVQSTTVDFWLASYTRWLNDTAGPVLNVTYETLYIKNNTTQASPSAAVDFSNNLTSATVDNSSDIMYNATLPEAFINNSSALFETKEDSNKTSPAQQGTSPEHTVPSNSSFDTLVNMTSTSYVTSQVDVENASSHLYNLMDSTSQTIPFLASLGLFLQSPKGRVYLRAIKLDNWTAPTRIMGSMMTFRHVKCQTSQCNIDAMVNLRELVDAFSFRGGGTCFVYANMQYMFNETNKVLKMELYRNLALAAICVFVVTLILITNIWTSMLVFICVVCTVIDVAGTMYFWDISVDTASSVILILCFGLAVDYSAHIGHSFMTTTGSKNERLQKTLISIGPAVFSGGFSTFLAFLLLVKSSSYGFTLFFKIFTSVVIFGLFHGLAFLPVILSIVGPPPYETQAFHTPDHSPTHNGDMNGGVMVANQTNGEAIALQCLRYEEFEETITPNGHLRNSASEDDVEDDPTQRLNENNPRYSGSYYEQMSNGSLVQIPFPGPH